MKPQDQKNLRLRIKKLHHYNVEKWENKAEGIKKIK